MSARYCTAGTVHLRHRTASGSLDNAWEYDPVEQRIRALVRAGSMIGGVDIEVCSPEQPRIGAHPIKRLAAESWRVEAVRYVREWPDGIERLSTIPCPIGDSLSPSASLTLTQSPPSTTAHLEAL